MRSQRAELLKSAAARAGWPKPGPPEVAFAGRSNAGKSSLINALVGRKGLARTSTAPGKTQLLHFFGIDGRFVLVDLPGYGFAKVPLAVRGRWQPMIEEYLGARETLRGVVVLIDARRGAGEMDLQLLEWLGAVDLPACIALTKADKLKRGERRAASEAVAEALMRSGGLYGRWSGPILASAKENLGRKELLAQLEDWIAGPPRLFPAA
ncbi:MAG: YihA family ribosome biogenesis GTP-binding protein [Candidatus Tectomicrobia bacterium]|nr:YihA family ribosome biogenesis GTP-binding protein [Candidatus Tectomicrobia bacterium]